MISPALLRAVVLAGLLATLIVGVPGRQGETQPVLRLSSAWHDGDAGRRNMARAWERRAVAPLLAVRTADTPPDDTEFTALEALARSAPLLAAAPGAGRTVIRAEPPYLARAERSGALAVDIRGTADDSLRVRLHDRAGPVDSMVVALDAHGHGSGAFRLRPPRDGWQEWSVEAAGERRAVGTWVREARAPRVLVAAGPPDWESRFVLRALDEAGVVARAVLPLGGGLHAGDAGTGVPTGATQLADFDAVIILPAAEVDAAQQRALLRFAAAGGGVLAVGRPDLWRALGIADEHTEAAADADALGWTLPAELAPLPAAELRVAALPMRALRSPVHAAAAHDAGILLALRPYGYGRTAALALTETWRWRMEAGTVDEHRAFWHALADWLAAGADAWPRLQLTQTRGAIARPVAVDVTDAAGDAGGAVHTLFVERPDGTRERLEVRSRGRDEPRHAIFLPAVPGLYRIALEDGSVRAAFLAEPSPTPGDDATARLALLATASGGALVPADSVAAWRDAWLAGVGEASPAAWARWLLFALILGAAFGEWAWRRLTGRA